MTTGTASTTNRVYSGDFDNAFYTTSTGNLYVCGNPGGTTEPTLYQIPITSGSMPSGAATAGPTLTGTNTANCSPITEFYGNNGGTQDLIFLSVTNDGSLGNCNSQGCIMSFDVTTASSFTSNSTPASSAVQSGGTTGIVIDNNTADTGANATGGSQVYFQPLSDQSCGGNGTVGTGTGPCATQASQNGLSE
jgi:hypothetical protein